MNRTQAYLLLDRLRVAQLRLASVALIVMMVVTLLDVFLRYVFNSPIRSSYDLVETMMAIFVFHGMSTALLTRRNIVIDLVDSFAPPFMVAVLIRISDVLTIATLALYGYAMITPALQAYNYGDLKMELGLPVWYLWAAALLGMAGGILCALGALIAPADPHHEQEPA
ncbi:MAG TPA: TRAP transporter small permease [Pseudolabrys sp.]|nr:TRAP transporter small permease [Pseudolabrys sp.]